MNGKHWVVKSYNITRFTGLETVPTQLIQITRDDDLLSGDQYTLAEFECIGPTSWVVQLKAGNDGVAFGKCIIAYSHPVIENDHHWIWINFCEDFRCGGIIWWLTWEDGDHKIDDGDGSYEGDGFLIRDIIQWVCVRTRDCPSPDYESDNLPEENLRRLHSRSTTPWELSTRCSKYGGPKFIQIHYSHNTSCIRQW